MKKTGWMFLICVALLACALFVGSGFYPREDVYLADFDVSSDGSQIEMTVGVASSAGYTRGFRAEQGGFNAYVTFHSAFGGPNGKLGAKNVFVLDIDAVNCDEIYFYNGGGGYKRVLQKNPLTAQWEKPE